MKKRVLLVEDNQMSSRLIEFVLTRDGFDVRVAASAAEAFAVVADEPPDIILMDIQLPDMDGLEATRRLKQDPETAKIPVVAITARALTGEEEKVRAAGCAGYITKPVNTRELAGTVEKFLSA